MLLRELATVAPVETLAIEEMVENFPVSVSVDNVTFKEGILEILKAAKVSYVVQGGDGEPFHLFAGDPEDRTPGRSRPAPEPDEPGSGSGGTEQRDVTGGALLLERPGPASVAMTFTLLGFGLLLGVPLAGYRPRAAIHRLLKRQRSQVDQRRRTTT